MQSEKFKVTPLERSWILYDVGNSAFVLMIATLVPIFFNALAEAGGLSPVNYLAYWGYASSVVTVITAVLGPIMGHGHIVDERAVRLAVDAPGELREAFKPRHRRVLAHKREEHTAARELIGGKVDDVHRVLASAGEDKVPDKNPGVEHAAFIEDVWPGLAVHFLYSGARDLRIVLRRAVPLRGGAVPIFEIGHVYLHKPRELLQRLDALITGAVPDDGDAK